MKHLKRESYLAALQGRVPFRLLHEQARRHLLEVCERCRRGRGRRRLRATTEAAPPPELPVPPPLPADRRAIAPEALAITEELLRASREARRRAREDLRRLERLPPERWPGLLADSRTRFRSGAFMNLLVEESRRRVRTSAPQATALAALVPQALAARPDRENCAWARVLLARAAAHRANALRVAGDLPAADTAIAALRARLDLQVDDPAAAAEIASLEASLRIGQRRFAEAEALLRCAAETYRLLPDPAQHGRTLIQQANLLEAAGRPAEIPALLAQAAALIDAEEEPYLYFCTVHGRVNALLDLDRPRDAEVLLAAEGAAYRNVGDGHAEALHGAVRARIDLGLGRFDAAAAGFLAVRDRFLALSRDYDAVLASLDLAATHLGAGDYSELRRLAAELVPLFQSRGVERETLAALRLLAEAVKAETLSAAALADLRKKLQVGPSPTGQAAKAPP